MQNYEKFNRQQAYLQRAQKVLANLQAEAMLLDLDKEETIISTCHTEITSSIIMRKTFVEPQYRRVPHGVIPDQPIYHSQTA